MKRKRKDGARVNMRAGKGTAFPHNEPLSSLLQPATRGIQNKLHVHHQPSQNRHISPNVHSQALRTLLSNQMQYLPATYLTFQDEKRMVPILRSNMVLSVDESQIMNRDRSADYHAAERIPKRWERQATSLPSSRPLWNHGNRCYRNAVLQALLHIPKVVNWMEIGHRNCEILDCTLCWFKGLCIEYWNQPSNLQGVNGRLISLEKNLKRTKAFQNRGWDFSMQNDAGDFAVAFMDAIIETNPGIGQLLNSMLGHVPVSTKICSISNMKTRTPKPEEQQRVLLVGWDRPMTLEQIMRKRTFSEHVFQLECEKCRRIHDISRKERLWTAPEVLIIQLQRFEVKTNQRVRKKMDAIAYPAELNLKEFSETNVELHYALQAVVHHRGTLDEGHYIAVAKGPSGRWELINDLNRPQMRNVPIQAALNPKNKYTPYLLFYVKVES